MKLKKLQNTAGFVLIEIIVTLLIISILLIPLGIMFEKEKLKAKQSNEKYLAQNLAQELAEELISGYDSGKVTAFNTRINATYNFQANVPTPTDIDLNSDGKFDGKSIKITIKKGSSQLAYLELVV
ncbi:MAG TPA: hypothetical protein DCK76_02480 [Desulfotomaculum sp.]|nr:MAG: hypothetical protein XD75_0229 [Parcubacteria bacterium 33_209]HAG10262.1 hypothetical protein [Desulfotomaculum sp.]HBY04331.1 hypothetical protein [Desulfotomaculum sp.]